MKSRVGQTVCAAALGTLIGVGTAWAATTHTVVQKGRDFWSADKTFEMTIQAGDAIAFVNDDFYDHNVYSETPGSTFNIGVQSRGETTRILLDQPGIVEVRCKIHPKMLLTVTVE